MKSCKIFWSTQSGRAKACARRTVRILREETCLDIKELGSSFDESSPETFVEIASNLSEDTFLILFVSTTGDGEHCDSIQDTWKILLQKSLPKGLFDNGKFAMFCLGDRAYGPQFCAAGRKLAVRLLQLGMNRFCDVGYGDDNTPEGGVFRDLDYWLEEQLLPLLDKNSSKDEVIDPNPYTVNQVDPTNGFPSDDGEEEWQNGFFKSSYTDYFTQFCPVSAYKFDRQTTRMDSDKDTSGRRQKTPPLFGVITSNERITAPDWEQDTRHIQMCLTKTQTSADEDSESDTLPSCSAPSLPYQAGDVATIIPFNSDDIVSKFLDVLPEDTKKLADSILKLSIDENVMNNSFTRWPRSCTFRGWLKYCADIHSLPEREDLRALSRFCSDQHPTGKDQKDKLRSLSETSEAALFADYILREKRSWADVLYDFDSLRAPGSGLTISALMVILPPMRPREFSIASAPSALIPNVAATAADNFSIDLCVAVVEGKTRFGRYYHGLCSMFLSQSIPVKNGGETLGRRRALQVWIRPGSFGKLPLEIVESKFETPILCVGAGTGVAPMRSLLLEREAVLQQSQSAEATSNVIPDDCDSTNDNILIFGSRKEKADYYYSEQWANLIAAKRNLRVLTAFSRDQFQKIYVQKVLREADNGTLITKHLLQRHGAVYIAGGPRMARAVKEEIVEALGKDLPGGEKAATMFLNKLQRMGKFSIEAWS